jgi:sodium/potassium/calcium exchanger 6
MLLLTILLFRMLASTAEDYFSPALEMLSMKLGFPPRFAGVSLLAVGNGAADVSSTVNAIVNDRVNGYKLSLGALTGAAMLVGGVVAGAIVIVAGGAPCRGALVRDVSMLALTVIVVWSHLRSGEIGPGSITLFFSLYGAFVVLVLVADLYHRGFVVPRLALQAQEMERQRQLSAQEDVVAAAGEALNDLARNSESLSRNPFQQPHQEIQPQCGPPAISTVLTALSNYGVDNAAQEEDGWGLESNQLAQERPIMLRGTHGILHGDGGGFTTHRAGPSDILNGENGDHRLSPDTPYSILTDSINQVCTEPGTVAITASSWKGAWHDGLEEIRVHARTVWEDIFWNGDVSGFEKFLLTCELPFIAARKVHRSSCCCFFVTDRTLLLSPLNRFERQQSLFPVRDTTAGHWWRCPWSVHHFGFGFTCGRSTMLIW